MDTKELIRLLNVHNVKYVIIGATAFPIHGYVRATLDIDIFIESTKENAGKTLLALKNFGYDVTDLTIDDLINNKILIRQYAVETDIHPFVKGITFKEVWDSKIISQFKGVKTFFASLESLIKMKKAAGRPKDLDDLQYLMKLNVNLP